MDGKSGALTFPDLIDVMTGLVKATLDDKKEPSTSYRQIEVLPTKYVQAKHGTKQTNSYIKRRRPPCKLQLAPALLHTRHQQSVYWRLPGDRTTIPVSFVNEIHNDIKNRVP